MNKAKFINFTLTFLGAVLAGVAILYVWDFIKEKKATKKSGLLNMPQVGQNGPIVN